MADRLFLVLAAIRGRADPDIGLKRLAEPGHGHADPLCHVLDGQIGGCEQRLSGLDPLRRYPASWAGSEGVVETSFELARGKVGDASERLDA